MHVAIVQRRFAELLLDGRKRIEARFYRTRRVPLGRIGPGESILFKLAAGPTFGIARVLRVRQFHDLHPARLRALRERYNAEICAPDEYWRARCGASYGVLVWVSPLAQPPRVFVPRQHGSGWVILSSDSGGDLGDACGRARA